MKGIEPSFGTKPLQLVAVVSHLASVGSVVLIMVGFFDIETPKCIGQTNQPIIVQNGRFC